MGIGTEPSGVLAHVLVKALPGALAVTHMYAEAWRKISWLLAGGVAMVDVV